MNKRNLKFILLLAPPLLVLIALFLSIDRDVVRPRPLSEQMADAGLLPSQTPSPSPAPSPTSAPSDTPSAAPVPTDPSEEELLSPALAAKPTPRTLAVSPTSKNSPTPTKRPKEAELPTVEEPAPTTPDEQPAADETPTPRVHVEDEDSRDRKNIILDMDYSTDVDDVAALRIATQLHKNGRINLMAVMASVNGEDVCKAMHGHLHYDGLGNVPVGRCVQDLPSDSPFWDLFISMYFEDSNYSVKDSVSLYKQKIRECAARGEKLRIITTGFLVNIESLLKDEPGYELVKEHVDAIWIVGGAYPNKGSDYNFWYTENAIRSAQYVNDHCPVKIVYSTDQTSGRGNDYGPTNDAVRCGGNIDQLDTLGTDPVNMAYRRFESRYDQELSGKGHLSWDPMCVWAASLTRAECRIKLQEVNSYIYEDGSNYFVLGDNEMRKIITRTSDDLDWYSAQLDTLLYQGLKSG